MLLPYSVLVMLRFCALDIFFSKDLSDYMTSSRNVSLPNKGEGGEKCCVTILRASACKLPPTPSPRKSFPKINKNKQANKRTKQKIRLAS